MNPTSQNNGLMTAPWETLSAEEQALITHYAHDDGVQLARDLYGPAGSRRADDRTVTYGDYFALYLKDTPVDIRRYWDERTVRQTCHDPRVYTFVAALERERRRLQGDTALNVDLPTLERANEITVALAEQISADVWAEAQLSEMVLLATRARQVLDRTLAHVEPHPLS